MSKRELLSRFKKFDKELEKTPELVVGLLGIPLGGSKVVEVPTRNSYVFVRLRDSQDELVQAFNDKVSPVYDLPVIVQYKDGHYVVIGRDTNRYGDWGDFSPYLPRHGNTHSRSTTGGGDIVWVYSNQFMPYLAQPSGTAGSPHVVINDYLYLKSDGTWRYDDQVGTASLLSYKPTGSGAVMVLIYENGDAGTLAYSVGSNFAENLTGTSQIDGYIPSLASTSFIPIAAVRLVSGTSTIGWDNIYDARQFFSRGGGGISTGSIAIYDEGILQGQATEINFVGDNVVATLSGQRARIFITGSVGGGSPTGNASGDLTGTYPNPEVVQVANSFALPNQIWGYLTGTNHNFNPAGLRDATVLRISGTNVASMTGLVGGYNGRILIIKNVNSFGNNFTLSAGVGSDVPNRFETSLQVDAGDAVVLQYSALLQKWTILASHYQFIEDADITFTDVTTGNADTDTHGFLPKLPGDGNVFLDGNGNWSTGTAGPQGPAGTSAGVMIWDEGIPLNTGTVFNFVGANVDASISGTVVRVFVTGSVGVGGSAAQPYISVYDDGVFAGSGTSFSYDRNLNIGISGSIIHIESPVSTYQRFEQPINLGGTLFRVPEGVYASGSLGVFYNGIAQAKGTDYEELIYISGTYHLLFAPATGTYHMVSYGVPCIAQTYVTGTGVSEFALADSDGELLLDSDGEQLLDSDG